MRANTEATIHFAGTFIADPSTVNNDSENFDRARALTPEQFKTTVTANKAWGWNPNGTGRWGIENCLVTNIDDPSGQPQPGDKAIGWHLAPSHSRTEGKLVDLDPDQQMVSQIWGFSVRLVTSDQQTVFSGDYRTTSFQDIWPRASQSRGMPSLSSFYHSVLQDVKWHVPKNNLSSPALQALHGSTTLSIRFIVDGYNPVSTELNFTKGRIVGSISAYTPSAPFSLNLGRALMTKGDSQKLVNRIYARLSGNQLIVDLGNSLPTTAPGGPQKDIGPLRLALVHAGGMEILGTGPIPYLEAKWYEKTSGIYRLELKADQVKLYASSRLVLIDDQNKIILGEYNKGSLASTSVKAEDFTYRLNPNETKSVKLIATRFGQPFPNAIIKVESTDPDVKGVELLDLNDDGTIKTNDQGIATFRLKGIDPGHPRKFDGQVFQVGYALVAPDGQVPEQFAVPSDLINVLVWDEYTIPAVPTWKDDVEPIFRQYANLYPVMQRMFNLASYESVTANLTSLRAAFSEHTPETSPHYMPVTRDLSAKKRAMIRKWLENPVYGVTSDLQEDKIISLEQLRAILQDAISLELSTIPPYLSALYSIKPGKNQDVAALLRSIVIEEMLHVALVCNVLNAIGGTPQLNNPDAISSYPGKMPHGINGDVTISLGPLTRERIRDIFLRIEAPEEIATVLDPLGTVVNPPTPTSSTHQFTIGEFYMGIKFALMRLCKELGEDKVFTGNSANQLKEWYATKDTITVNNLQSALFALEKIITQGEGVSKTNPISEADTPAHYYRFWEIYQGQKIRATFKADGACIYQFTSEKIEFDPSGVYPMTERTTPGSRLADAKGVAARFNEMYARLLNSLQATFNGSPNSIGDAISIMRHLQLLAQDLMQIADTANPGHTLGPDFDPVPYLEKKTAATAPLATLFSPLHTAQPFAQPVGESAAGAPPPVGSLFAGPGIALFKRMQTAAQPHAKPAASVLSALPTSTPMSALAAASGEYAASSAAPLSPSIFAQGKPGKGFASIMEMWKSGREEARPAGDTPAAAATSSPPAMKPPGSI